VNDAVKAGGPCVSKTELKELKELTFPGRLPLDELRIAIAPGAHAAVQTHAKSSLDKEICGVLLGKPMKDAQGLWLVIEDVIEGKAAQGSEAKVTFTPDAWEHIFKEQEIRDPSLKMVGWYHTHPRFGIFLSHYDQFIHQNFFAVEPWMVAYVVDPVQDEEGFFFWHRGKTKRVERFWIGDTHRLSDGAEFDGRDLADDRAPPPEETRTRAVVAPLPGLALAPSEVPLAWYKDPFVWVFAALVGLALVAWGGWNLVFDSPAERDARKTRELLNLMVLYQIGVQDEIDELRKDLNLPPSNSPHAKQLRAFGVEFKRSVEEQANRNNPFRTDRAPPKTPAPTTPPPESRPIDPPKDAGPVGPPAPPGENQSGTIDY